MTLRLSTGMRNRMAGQDGFSAIFEAGIIEVYTGAQPATADAAPTGTMLGVVTTNGGPFTPGDATNGLLWAAPANAGVNKAADLWRFTGLTTGTAGWFRLKGNALDAGGVSTLAPRMDGSIATSGADLNLSNTSVALGSPNTIDVFQLTLPAQ